MKTAAFKGWCVFSGTSRREWPIVHTLRATRREAISAFKDEMRFHCQRDPDGIYKRRVKSGAIRVGRVVVQSADMNEEN